MKEIYSHYMDCFKRSDYLVSLLLSFVLLGLSFVVNFYAGTFASSRVGNYVEDIILSNIPVWNVDFLFIQGSILMWIFVILILLVRPQRIPFVLKSVALFVVIRAVFISVTHLGPFPTADIITHSSILGLFTFEGDLFFSGHTGLPFLLSLIFWDHKILRYIFLVLSLVFGATVLMGHIHYTIDVLGAFFITFTIYHIARYLFPHDRERFVDVFKRQRQT
ncbi:MAG: hypothetical protein COV07_02175 [Candidatus Vogelbacteria bacterium CG10_big_fil_rev_8_21_14_0_10_45_14]|uniref:Sphingomyelin synthase-like domain-containing protein n=1 Tax=Candidatus Vogelbacteria bacterium CG10_big_fil_rev_8_21_14_0_10_45_14 TaxID=1975042 RepID=A0A2H0RJX6_9BACT|nr:MAG: hypothetical protein COV07_02175 [Candidatus Vogelbacteria bacterium CG10_big_fil_rev_8_21_14_0_10_45_14]